MTFNLSVAKDAQERRLFRSIFNEWVMTQASEEDWQQLEQARERFAPNEVCSAVRLVRGCLARQELPQSLRQLLQERNWPQSCDDATAP